MLSLFNGIGVAITSVKNNNFEIENCFVSEIDKNANAISKNNHSEQIEVGDVRDISYKDGFLITPNNKYKCEIDLLIGGSPCQSFSFAGKQKGMITSCNIDLVSLDQYLELKKLNYEFEGQSYLFWEYMRLLREINPKYFLLENVQMIEKWKSIITENMGVQPILINSSLLTFQNRNRNYWTNISQNEITDLNISFKDNISKSTTKTDYYSDKSLSWLVKHSKNKLEKTGKLKSLIIKNNENKCETVTASHSKNYSSQRFFAILDDGLIIKEQQDFIKQKILEGDTVALKVLTNYNDVLDGKCSYRYYTVEELEKAQGLKTGYTSIKPKTSAMKAIGNGFTEPVITHILQNIKV